ncbi:amino acid adenylation domain-containing protein [Amycolatopsis samaneae]|uniref:Amino acid adenylation domain-containing protein n=1 Tax=Amycolatopsis samaneae TaxID=664691 RepID=A0ABW5GK71_9PSEU
MTGQSAPDLFDDRQGRPPYHRSRHGIHNLSRPEVIADPNRYIDPIRELGPVFFDEVSHIWVCSGYRESVEVLTGFRNFSSARARTAEALDHRRLGPAAGVAKMTVEQMLFTDPPDHTRIRSCLQSHFTPGKVAEHDEIMREIAQRAIRELPSHGTIELITGFAAKLSSPLVCALLGIPGHEPDITKWAEAYETLLGSLSTLPDIQDESVIPVLDEALAFFRAEADARIAAPGDDILSALAVGLAEGPAARENAPLDLIAANCVVLLGGGYQTLTQLVSSALVLLDGHPDQQRRLRAEPHLIDSAINEVMRLNGSSQYVARRTTTDVELAGHRIPADSTILVHLAAANLDPREFTEPHRLDIARREARHLGFGLGRHYCLGAPYAERTARWAILGFLDRYAEYGVQPGADAVRWGPHPNTRCPARVSVRVGETPPVRAPLPDHAGHHLLVDWNDTGTPIGPTGLWHQVFEHRARLTPDAVAVEDPAGEHTYREIDQRANALARTLRAHEIQPEALVAVVMERSANLVVSTLAIAKAGGAFLLCDPSCPEERLDSMVRQARAALILADTETAPTLRESAAGRSVPVFVPHVGPVETRGPLTGVSAGNTAYVVFTSGTTGRPKGIAVSHEGVVNLHVAQRQIFRLGPHDRVLQFLSPNFDGCVADIMLALLSGAVLVLAPRPSLTVGPPLARLLRGQRITTVILTPSVWAALPETDLPDLRIAAAAGERLPAAVLAKWSAPGRRFLNLYGPAETAVLATWHECERSAPGDPPIGRPVANKRTYVLDERSRPLPVGEAGELCIGGLGIGRYLWEPALMEERFAPAPAETAPGQLVYRTGDICRWLPDGSLEYLGRRDRQVKIRGQRIELEEVERVLAAVPGVTFAKADVREGRLEATVTTARDMFDEAAVRAHLAERLHSGMIPAVFTVVDDVPLTTNGKAGRPAAPSDAPARPAETVVRHHDERGDLREHSRLTWRISRLFADCLGVPQQRVKADSDFFSLGGDSLTTATLLSGLESQMTTEIDVEVLLDHPTPAEMSHHIAGRRPAG